MRLQLKLSKKSGIILGGSLLLFFLTIAVGISLFFSGDGARYLEDISPHCQISEERDGETIVECRGILTDYSESSRKIGAGEECFQISVLKEDLTFEGYTLCEKRGFVKFDREIFINEELEIPSEVGVAMDFQIKYKRNLLRGLTLRSIEFTYLPDPEVSELTKELASNGRQLPRLRSDLQVAILESGYYYTPYSPEELLEGYRLGQIFFYTGEIREMRLDSENSLVVVFGLELYGEEYLVELSRKSFEYIGLENGFEPILVDKDNYQSVFTPGAEVQLLFRYVAAAETDLEERLVDACAKVGPSSVKELTVLCRLLEYRTLEELAIEDMDLYLKEVLGNSETGELGEFDKLIFKQIIFR